MRSRLAVRPRVAGSQFLRARSTPSKRPATDVPRWVVSMGVVWTIEGPPPRVISSYRSVTSSFGPPIAPSPRSMAPPGGLSGEPSPRPRRTESSSHVVRCRWGSRPSTSQLDSLVARGRHGLRRRAPSTSIPRPLVGPADRSAQPGSDVTARGSPCPGTSLGTPHSTPSVHRSPPTVAGVPDSGR